MQQLKYIIKYLLSLINDILDFSKIESGKMDIIPVDYDLGILLSDTIDMIRSRAEEKKLQLELIIERGAPEDIISAAPLFRMRCMI